MNGQLFVATRKGLFTFEREGETWRVAGTAFLGVPVSIVFPDQRDGSIFAAVNHGHFGAKLHRSIDGGQTWPECGTPTYPDPPADAQSIRCPNRGVEIPWSLELIWSLEAGDNKEPGVLWCGTIPGGLFRSADQGTSWSLVHSLWDHPSRKHWFGGGYDYPGLHSICVHPTDPRHVTVGLSCGGVWLTVDEGNSWETRADGMYATYMPPERRHDPYIQDPHRVVQCKADPASLWAQHHNGVFRSTDGGMTWHDVPNVPASTFGFATAVHPHDPKTAWFVPAVSDERRIAVDGKLLVARTRDGGASFDALTFGLPNRHVYDIVFRHALDVDATGDRVAFGSTTGSLWISSDQGEHWQGLSTHLPPIHAVRFA